MKLNSKGTAFDSLPEPGPSAASSGMQTSENATQTHSASLGENKKRREILSISVSIRPSSKLSALKAHADVRMEIDDGALDMLGFSVIQKEGAAPFVGFPSRQGNTPGRYFPIVEADGRIRKEIIEAILTAYQKNEWR
jgi:hypothetical protein